MFTSASSGADDRGCGADGRGTVGGAGSEIGTSRSNLEHRWCSSVLCVPGALAGWTSPSLESRSAQATWITEKNKEFEDESSCEKLDLEEDVSKSEPT
jgi:hypothetical protein